VTAKPDPEEDHMTTLPDRPNAAVLVIDLQNGVVAHASRRDEVIANINAVVGKARAAEGPVIWVQHQSEELPEGSEQWQLVPELELADGEPVVHKRYGDSFENTTLEDELARRGVGRLLVTGAQTDACVRSTLHGAFTRGYDTTLVSDAHTTEDLTQWGAPPPEQVIAHTNLYWSFQRAPGREAAVVASADVAFG
jgi:nicotinamidase-related amidase